jgi:hypothetical protein
VPRKARIDAHGPLYHAIDKGIVRKKAFDDEDGIGRDFFLNHLPTARRRYKDFVQKVSVRQFKYNA